MNNICIDCGSDYEYDSRNPLGSSSVRCSKCRKANSKLNKKIALFQIAGNGIGRCRKCGYGKNISALILVDSFEPLKTLKTDEELKTHARSQYIICLNCNAEIESGEIQAKVTNASAYPILVSFFETRVYLSKIDSIYSSESLPMEVVSEETLNMRNVQNKSKLIE